MATNNLLVNNEKKVLYDIQKRVERSGHNLSQSRKFPCKVGYIYPFFCRKTLPSDSFKISTNILIKQLQPLLVPQMVSFTVNTAFYWVDYQLAFPQFEYFLINQRGQQNIELPYISYNSDAPYLPAIPDENLHGNVRTYLDFSRNECGEKIDALPFWAYKTIYRDFYLNIDRLSDTEYQRWFPQDPNDWKLRPGANVYFGNEDDSVYPESLEVHNVRGDYFVNSYPTPLRGDIPTLTLDFGLEGNSLYSGDITAVLEPATNDLDSFFGLGNNDYLAFSGSFNSLNGDGLTWGSSNPLTTLTPYTTPEGSGVSSNRVFVKNNFEENPPTSATQPYNVFERFNYNIERIKNVVKNPRTYAGYITLGQLQGLTGSAEYSVRQLRLLESLTRKREIDILMKPRLKNYLQTYFDVKNYQNDSLYQPVFIGSTTQQILINDIDQTTATSDSPLGRQAATAMSLGSGFVGEYFCRNYGCLMGVMYILPDYDYEPALPREWTERTPDDFYNPEFAHLSMQPILNKELFVSNDTLWNNEVLGYGGIYDNYRTSSNLVSGDLLNSSMIDVQQFAQVRRFSNSNKPEITTSFLNSAAAFDSSVFSVPSLPPFIAQCVTRVEAVRPIPEIATPRDM